MSERDAFGSRQQVNAVSSHQTGGVSGWKRTASVVGEELGPENLGQETRSDGGRARRGGWAAGKLGVREAR